MTLTATIVTLAVCLLFEAFFSGAELALISADKVALRHRAERSRHGQPILRFLQDPGQLISTALVGTNICVVLSTVVATLGLMKRFPEHAELLSLALMTPLVLVFGEILPKSVFQHFADRLAPRLILILAAFRLGFYPLVALGSGLSRALLRSLRIKPDHDVMSRDELRLLITLPSTSGADRITVDEKQMISRIFEFTETTVVDVMLPLSEVTALSADASLRDLATAIADKRHTRIPLYEQRVDQIVGIVHAFDVLRATKGAQPRDLSRTAIFVPENQPAVDTLMRLKREGQGMAVVVDEYGGAVGVVTVEDILEEVVGEIQDEYDAEPTMLIRDQGDGKYVVKGRATVESLNAVAGLALPIGEDYETVAGLVLDRLKVIPRAGRRLAIDGIVVTVSEVTDRSVEEVHVVVPGGPK